MNLGPNSPCHCGSGRKYKHCHRPIDEAPPEDRYQAGQREGKKAQIIDSEIAEKNIFKGSRVVYRFNCV
jgi:hypothetical protein